MNTKINFNDLLITGRGSTALWLILKVLDKKFTNILVPANICEIIYPIIKNSDLKSVFYDVDSATGVATPQIIDEAYTGKEEILIVLHQFGLPVKIDEICTWAKSKNIFVIEDVCCALGATYDGQPLGTWGHAAIFSFGYSKIIEYGVGGAVYSRDNLFCQKINDQIKHLPPYSKEHKNKDIELQKNINKIRNSSNISKIDEYNYIYNQYMNYLLFKLEFEDINNIYNLYQKLEININNRSFFADRYRKEIANSKITHVQKIPGQTYWRYNILVSKDNQKELIQELRLKGHLASNWYPPIPKLFERSYNPSNFSGCESFASTVVNLFVDHRVNNSKVTQCINLINKF